MPGDATPGRVDIRAGNDTPGIVDKCGGWVRDCGVVKKPNRD